MLFNTDSQRLIGVSFEKLAIRIYPWIPPLITSTWPIIMYAGSSSTSSRSTSLCNLWISIREISSIFPSPVDLPILTAQEISYIEMEIDAISQPPFFTLTSPCENLFQLKRLLDEVITGDIASFGSPQHYSDITTEALCIRVISIAFRTLSSHRPLRRWD